jgi:sulfotransferase 6B1
VGGASRAPAGALAGSNTITRLMPKLAKLIADHDTLKRRALVPTYRALARTNVFYPGPRVLANSFPKAGTHLLGALMAQMPQLMFSGVHHAVGDFTAAGAAPEAIALDWVRLRRALAGVNRGHYMTGHFPAVPGLPELLDDLGYARVLMVRDPRDVVVSGQHYVTSLRSHDLHRRYTQVLTTPDRRLMASIVGFPADEHSRGLEPIGARLQRYLAWRDDPRSLVVRFEDLIGPAGGGSAETQRATVVRIARHVGRELSPDRLGRVAGRVWSDRSSTFRSGRTGGWREHFTDEHRRAFKTIAGQLLIDLGYESDLDW